MSVIANDFFCKYLCFRSTRVLVQYNKEKHITILLCIYKGICDYIGLLFYWAEASNKYVKYVLSSKNITICIQISFHEIEFGTVVIAICLWRTLKFFKCSKLFFRFMWTVNIMFLAFSKIIYDRCHVNMLSYLRELEISTESFLNSLWKLLSQFCLAYIYYCFSFKSRLKYILHIRNNLYNNDASEMSRRENI